MERRLRFDRLRLTSARCLARPDDAGAVAGDDAPSLRKAAPSACASSSLHPAGRGKPSDVASADVQIVGEARCERKTLVPARSTSRTVPFALVVLAAFALYWLSALVLEARGEADLFGTDRVLYAELANGNVVERIGNYYAFDRITRFHPLTTVLAVVWMKVLGPLTSWITPQQLLKALFAAAGALGVWAAMAAFATVVPRRHVALWGTIYATSLSVWYFSSIEESKIVSAALTALYIATYLNLRKSWTVRGASLLTAILLLACLNGITAGLLVAIPAVDTLVRRGWNLREGRWVALHGLAAPAALLFLELVVNRHVVGATTDGPGTELEGASHLSMLVFYVAQNDFSIATLYAFLVNWLFFNIAAPTVTTTLAPAAWPEYTSYFEPVLANYLSSPVPVGLLALFGVIAVASALPKRRAESAGDLSGVLAALLAYALLRGLFWFIVNPFEAVLFGSAVTLAHMLLVAIPFAASRLPAKQGLLAAFALLLFITNATFIIGG